MLTRHKAVFVYCLRSVNPSAAPNLDLGRQRVNLEILDEGFGFFKYLNINFLDDSYLMDVIII